MSAAIMPTLIAQQGNGPPLALIFWAVVILIFIVRNLFRFSAGLVEANKTVREVINTVRLWLGKEPLGQKIPRRTRSEQPDNYGENHADHADKYGENHAELEEADPLEDMEPLEHFGRSESVSVSPKAENERLREEIRRFQLQRRPLPPSFEPAADTPPISANRPNFPQAAPYAERPADASIDAPSGAFSTAALAESLANPTDLRKAILLSEILRRPNWE